jgi:photosystem II stability/assembly factor-like uncharacterized protein
MKNQIGDNKRSPGDLNDFIKSLKTKYFITIIICSVCFHQPPQSFCQTSLANSYPNEDNVVYDIAVAGTNIFAATNFGLFYSTNNGKVWLSVNHGLPYLHVYRIAISGDNIFIGTGYGIYRSTINELNWHSINNGLGDHTLISAIAVMDSNLFVGAGGLFRSTDYGDSWIEVMSAYGPPFRDIYSLYVYENMVFTGTTIGIFRSTDNGTSWYEMNNGLTNPYVYSFASLDSHLYAGTLGGGVFCSTDNGFSWSAVNNGITSVYIEDFCVSGNYLFAGTMTDPSYTAPCGIYRSTNYGENWLQVNTGLADSNVLSLASSGTSIFAGTLQGRVFCSTNNGASWTPIDSGLIVTSVFNQTNFPEKYYLAQNYPNPFNSTTRIDFQIPEDSFVSLKVFDCLGNEIEIIVSEIKKENSYTVNFDASNLASGMYFYQLTAVNFISTKKMVLLK